jgi:hypothetical protein
MPLAREVTSNAIAAGIDVFELARVMGTSIEMIERHYGTLLSGAAAGIASRLAAFEAASSSLYDVTGDTRRNRTRADESAS